RLPDGLSAKARRDRSTPRQGQSAGRTGGTYTGIGEKTPRGQAGGPVEQHIVPYSILVEQADPGPQHGLTRFPGIPCQSQLGREIQVRLVHAVAQSRPEPIEFRNGRKIAVRAARIAVVTHSVGNSEIWLRSPGITDI